MRASQSSTWRPVPPIATLIVLAPIMVEVLFGATRISMLYLLLPQICIYGGAALIIRTLVRRRHRGWGAILLLGIAFAVAEECVILQTSVSPPYQHLLFGAAPNQHYLGAFGVNWAYLLWALGYESVWGIVLPIQLTELIFPAWRNDPWLGRRGLGIAALVFLLPSVGIWYTFTQVGIAAGLAYEAPLLLVLLALAFIVALGAVALGPWPSSRAQQPTDQAAPRPWLVGVAACGLGLPWFVLAILPYVVPASFPLVLPIVIALGWAASALLLFRHWSRSPAWQDSHRLALVVGALLASMAAGFVINGPTLSPVDLLGKVMLNLSAIGLLAYLGWAIHRRQAVQVEARQGVRQAGTPGAA